MARTTRVGGLVLAAFLSLHLGSIAYASGPVYQPPGANLTYGDVTHGSRVQSASTNPAAAAADLARGEGNKRRGTVVSLAAGLEYGNVQNIFDIYDKITGSYKPSDPAVDPDAPGQLPEEKPPFDLGDIFDQLDPEFKEMLDAAAREVAIQVGLLAVIASEGYARAWATADAPFLLGREYLGGAWTFGVNWSGSATAFGIPRPIDFDRDQAQQIITDWLTNNPTNLPGRLPISRDVELRIDPVTTAVLFAITNDSSFLTKSTQTTELNFGYSADAWNTEHGSLFLGAEARVYFMGLSRLSTRFGDITDSEELWDSIKNSELRHSQRLGVDVGALWVAENYQLGVQITNLNEPTFSFPGIDLGPYSDIEIIEFLERDTLYVMDSQVKLEASLFSKTRRWSAHLGFDADSATDPMGDKYQWATASLGMSFKNWVIPNLRLGYRQNLAGTQLSYLGVGATMFKYVNIDIASAFETVKISGTELPQGLMFSLGFQINW